MGNNSCIKELKNGLETAFIDAAVLSADRYKPSFVYNDRHEGKKVLASIEDELNHCDCFRISVAFITMEGIAALLQSLKELEARNIPGQILTTNYLSFSEPAALEKLHGLKNIELRMFDVNAAKDGFHTKGYIFQTEEQYRIIIGSSNMTSAALTTNHEWNTRIISTSEGEMAKEILAQFDSLWGSEYSSDYDDFIEQYREEYRTVQHQREIAKKNPVVSLEQYKLTPNSMQTAFIANLRRIIENGEDRALLISATGTGKTFASAFAMRELGFRRVLFLVHRGQLARQTKKSYEMVFPKDISMGIVGSGSNEYDADFVFATVQTMSREEHLQHYAKDAFDCIIMDEAHRSAADSYKDVIDYFRPKFWLGMTATPDRRDSDKTGRNVYELFNYQIAYEIRLQQAMEEQLLCPFHYFGISDLSVIGDEKKGGTVELKKEQFNRLVSDERVRHVISQAKYYGFSGSRVKGLVFCSRLDESEELSRKFNEAGYRTIALNGSANDEERQEAFERLAMEESESTPEKQPLDYIFSVEILNEGVDIVEVNQVIMLRPTQSPIIFIQQLGRGLRKAEGKEYVIILDFIGNYQKNFLIPVALSGDGTYNKDRIRQYVTSGNNVIPGASTIHFDAVAKEKIFRSIDKIRGLKTIIRESYANLKNRLGRVPYLLDFYENAEVDPMVILKEYKTYNALLISMEKEPYFNRISEAEQVILEYLSKTVASGVRPYELSILKKLLTEDKVVPAKIKEEIEKDYQVSISDDSMKNAIHVLQGQFVAKDEERQRYYHIDIMNQDPEGMIQRMRSYEEKLSHQEFYRQIEDLISVGLRKYGERYAKTLSETPFVLYERYSRRDVCLLMNYGQDISSTMYGMKRIGNDVFIFVTYHKVKPEDESRAYLEGKPDYADSFADNMIFRWDSQIGKGPDSSYMNDVTGAVRRHLFVKKSDAEQDFYYMGMFDIQQVVGDTKKDNKGKTKALAKVTMRMHQPVRDDILKYLESSIEECEEVAI